MEKKIKVLLLRGLARPCAQDLARAGLGKTFLGTLRARPCADVAPFGICLARLARSVLRENCVMTSLADPCADLARALRGLRGLALLAPNFFDNIYFDILFFHKTQYYYYYD